jgi:hypothetical protein
MSPSNVIGLMIAILLIGSLIPLLAWRDSLKGFSRRNWVGVAVGALAFAIVLAVAGAVIGDKLRETADWMQPEYKNPNAIKMVSPDGDERMESSEFVNGMELNGHYSLAEGSAPSAEIAEYERAVRRAKFWPQVLDFLGGLFCATGIGAFLAVFFCKAGPQSTNS